MTKQELENDLLRKESQLFKAESESDTWNQGKYKNSSNAQISKIFVRSLQSEISELRQKIAEMEKGESDE
ncbi:hypothetical protein [Photobacterium leiognathi]|uniref:hypothetical protein n=1 Tax=Photobacterium leiognathi TaxID=553611 RepID=UPI002732EE7B|nr:hypothetical protein [Photobacterium leiognathi]